MKMYPLAATLFLTEPVVIPFEERWDPPIPIPIAVSGELQSVCSLLKIPILTYDATRALTTLLNPSLLQLFCSPPPGTRFSHFVLRWDEALEKDKLGKCLMRLLKPRT